MRFIKKRKVKKKNKDFELLRLFQDIVVYSDLALKMTLKKSFKIKRYHIPTSSKNLPSA